MLYLDGRIVYHAMLTPRIPVERCQDLLNEEGRQGLSAVETADVCTTMNRLTHHLAGSIISCWVLIQLENLYAPTTNIGRQAIQDCP